LDALGLLDEQERAEFETAFRAASPEVQSQIRREQLRFVDLEHLLPSVDAPAGLRARVMAAVREAISAVSTPRAQEGAIARIGPALAGRAVFNTAPVWRAACIGFATACVVLSLFFVWMAKETKQITAMVNQDQVAEFLQQNAGPRAIETFLGRDLRQYSFIPAAADFGPTLSARLFVDPEKGEAILFCRGLPEVNGTYRLIVESEGGLKEVDDFKNNGGIISIPITVDVKAMGRLTIEGPRGKGAGEGEILRFEEA
jgi:hypothetical protein